MGRPSARPLRARLQPWLAIILFVYRINDRQRFIKIGKTPVWSLEAARKRANELRAIFDEGNDPASYRREREKVRPVENVIQYIAKNQQK